MLRQSSRDPRNDGEADAEWSDTVQAQERKAEQMRRAFGGRGERSCCDGRCLQRHGICPAVQQQPEPKRPSLWERFCAFFVDPIVRD